MRAESQERKGGTADPARLRIAEIYASRQGEGQWAGVPSIFLRTSGCNLRCWFCDTPFASWHPEGESLSIDEILERTLSLAENDVVITGGEPLLFTAMTEITQRLHTAGRRLTIETAGTVDQEFTCDLLSISPKLASSAPDQRQHATWFQTHNARRYRPDLVRHWLDHYHCQLKFVVGSPDDCREVLEYLEMLASATAGQVWIMPEGTSVDTLDQRATWLEPWCAQHGFHFCQRQHIYWYGNQRGT